MLQTNSCARISRQLPPARRLADAAELARRLRTLDARRAKRARERIAVAEAERTRRALDLARARRTPLLAVVAVLLVGLAISSWLYLRADAANGRAENERACAQTVTKFLTDDLLSSANPFLAADPNITVKYLLKTASRDLDHRFLRQSLDRAAIERTIGNAYSGLSEPQRALPLLNAALAIRRAKLGDADTATQEIRLDVADLHNPNLDFKATRKAGQSVLDSGRAAGKLDFKTGLKARYDVAFADCQLKGTSEGCIAPLQPLLNECRNNLGATNEFCIDMESELAFSLGDAQRFREAVPMARDALALSEKTYGPNHLLVQDRKFKLAESLSDAGDVNEAIALLTQVRHTLLSISGSENEATARAANELAKSYGDAKRYDKALPLLQLALDYHLKSRGPLYTLSRAGMNNVANTLAFMGREQEAIAMGTRAVALERQALGPDHPETLWFENNLANFYDRAHDFTLAEATYRDVLARARRTFTKGEWDLGHFAFHLGAILAEEGKKAEARAVLQESVTILTKALGKDNARTKRALGAPTAL